MTVPQQDRAEWLAARDRDPMASDPREEAYRDLTRDDWDDARYHAETCS